MEDQRPRPPRRAITIDSTPEELQLEIEGLFNQAVANLRDRPRNDGPRNLASSLAKTQRDFNTWNARRVRQVVANPALQANINATLRRITVCLRRINNIQVNGVGSGNHTIEGELDTVKGLLFDLDGSQTRRSTGIPEDREIPAYTASAQTRPTNTAFSNSTAPRARQQTRPAANDPRDRPITQTTVERDTYEDIIVNGVQGTNLGSRYERGSDAPYRPISAKGITITNSSGIRVGHEYGGTGLNRTETFGATADEPNIFARRMGQQSRQAAREGEVRPGARRARGRHEA